MKCNAIKDYNKSRLLLYTGHLLSAWGDRMWQFALGLFLVVLQSGSLRLAAIYGFAQGFSVLLAGAAIGNWVDRTQRLKAFLGGMAARISIEKDWIVVMSLGDANTLAEMNAMMRRIDLICNAIAPYTIGQVMTSISVWAGAVLIGVWNVVSFLVEYYIRYRIYHSTPQLQGERRGDEDGKDVGKVVEDVLPVDESSDIVEMKHMQDEQPNGNDVSGPSQYDVTVTHSGGSDNILHRLYRGWTVYVSQTVSSAGLGLALLYLTVLGWDSVTVGYGQSQGASEAFLGAMYGVSSVLGVLGTLLYPVLRARIGIEVTGLVAACSHITTLLLCVVSAFLPGSPFILIHHSATALQSDVSTNSSWSNMSTTSSWLDVSTNSSWSDVSTISLVPVSVSTANITDTNEARPDHLTISYQVLLTGLILSRFGLWMFDLTCAQLLQERVPAADRGAVNGVQESLNQLMDMIKFAIVIALPYAPTYGYLILVSATCVTSGYLCYTYYTYRVTGHFCCCSTSICDRGSHHGRYGHTQQEAHL